MISSSNGKPAGALTLGRPKILGRPRVKRCWELSHFLAMSLECQARIVGGLTRLVTFPRACLPSFWPISVSV
jgi:hypothetical protein